MIMTVGGVNSISSFDEPSLETDICSELVIKTEAFPALIVGGIVHDNKPVLSIAVANAAMSTEVSVAPGGTKDTSTLSLNPAVFQVIVHDIPTTQVSPSSGFVICAPATAASARRARRKENLIFAGVKRVAREFWSRRIY